MNFCFKPSNERVSIFNKRVIEYENNFFIMYK